MAVSAFSLVERVLFSNEKWRIGETEVGGSFKNGAVYDNDDLRKQHNVVREAGNEGSVNPRSVTGQPCGLEKFLF